MIIVKNVDFRVEKLRIPATKNAIMRVFSDSSGSVIEILTPESEISFFLNPLQSLKLKRVI